jgi:hypothetical protein
MTLHPAVYEQAEKLILFGREHRLDIDGDWLRGVRVGRKWYNDPLTLSVDLLKAFDTVGLRVPAELRARPTFMYVEDDPTNWRNYR